MTGGRRSFLAAGMAALAAATGARAAPRESVALRPDPQSDQSAAFAKALAAAATAGRVLTLEAGVYRLSAVALPDGAAIAGVSGRTRLVPAGAGPLFTAKGAGRLRLHGLALEGTGAQLGENDGLLALEGVAALDLSECTFSEITGRAVSLQGCGGRIGACTFEGTRTAIYVNDSKGLAITANTVRKAGDNGILVHRSAKGDDGTIVSQNRIETVGALGGGLGWNGNGINVFRAGGVIVAHNVLRDCAFSFIRANAADAVQIIGNSCDRAGETGLYSEFGFEGAVISGNTVVGAANGISTVNYDKGGRLAAIQGNIVRGAFRRPLPEGGGEAYGYGIAAEADASVTGNVVEGCAQAGIAVGYGNFVRNVALTGNVIRQCGSGVEVTVAEAERAVLVSGNVITACPGGAVVGMKWADRATGDLALSGSEAYPGISVGGNLVR